MIEGKRSGVEYIEIDGDRAGQRLDNFLSARLKGVPKGVIYRILRTGQVRVNKGRAKPAYKLQPGDIIRIPPITVAESPEIPPAAKLAGQSLQSEILFEDEGLLVINKPAGLAVHGGSGLEYGLIEAMRAWNPAYKSVELVHRLDRETSGCLLLAKNRETLVALHGLLREHRVEKTYNALLQGRLLQDAITVDAPLDRNRSRGGERVAVLDEDGKAASTHIELVERYADTSLVNVKIDTGRTHQIRVHCASLGHPLAGDDKYGDRDFNRLMRKAGLRRMFLHAARLRFTLGKTYDIRAPLPPELENVVTSLEHNV